MNNILVLRLHTKPRKTVEEGEIGIQLPYVAFRMETNYRGRDGDEIEDFIEEEHITTSKPRRRSNSNSNAGNGNGGSGVAGTIKNKFEVNDIDEEAVDEQ
jgi:hypothetical protein